MKGPQFVSLQVLEEFNPLKSYPLKIKMFLLKFLSHQAPGTSVKFRV